MNNKFKQVKKWVVGDGRAKAVNTLYKWMNNPQYLANDDFPLEIPSVWWKYFEDWRNKPDNQPYTNAKPGTYDADAFGKIKLQRCQITGVWTGAIKNKPGYQYRYFLPIKEVVKQSMKNNQRTNNTGQLRTAEEILINLYGDGASYPMSYSRNQVYEAMRVFHAQLQPPTPITASEGIEQAAEKYAIEQGFTVDQDWVKDSFKAGANWQSIDALRLVLKLITPNK
jgi:hypothetical protein